MNLYGTSIPRKCLILRCLSKSAIWMLNEKATNMNEICRYLVVDANWPANIIANCVENGKKQGSTVVFEPVSTAKSARLFT